MAKATAKKYRVLSDVTVENQRYLVNQLVLMAVAVAAQHVKDGQLDDSDAAVKYLESQGVEPIVHISAEEAAAAAEQLEAEKKAQALAALEAEIKALEVKLGEVAEADKATIQAEIDAKKAELSTLQQG